MTTKGELEAAVRLTLEAGAALRRHQGGPLDLQRKARGEPVTAADLNSNAIIRAGLEAAFPADAIFSEESADSPDRLWNPRVWIVDPLDSTSNFLEGGDEFCVSVGLAVCGLPRLGVVYNPSRDQLFAGAEGLGVRLNGAAVRPTGASRLEGARLTVSRKEWSQGLQTLGDGLPLLPVASMAYKLARVAAGLDDAVVSFVPRKEWGTCAGVALVLAGGGRASLLDGGAIAFNRRDLRQPLGMVAAGPRLHTALSAALPDAMWQLALAQEARA